jgi:hypothetical protein
VELTDLSHEAVRALLPEYVALAAQGIDPEAVHPQLAAHLADCSSCAEEFQELIELAAITYSGAFEPAAQAPDLSFLRSPRAPARLPVVRTSLGQLLVTFTRPLVEALLQPRLAGAFRGQLLYRASQTTQETPPAHVQLELRAEGAASCSISIRLQLPEQQALHQAGALVQLRAGAFTQEAALDDAGTAIFSGLPTEALPLLRLIITPDGAPGQAPPTSTNGAQ